jgi:hypothetical protein
MKLKPGLYLDLDEDIYFAQDALGSSDLKQLLRAPCDWWYGSRHNPHRTQSERGKHLILGRALHALMLEGTQAYEARFSVEPDPNDYPGALKTADDIKDLLRKCEIPFKSNDSKGALIKIARDNNLAGRIWDEIKAQHTQEVELFGKSPISAAQDRALRDMSKLVEGQPSIAKGLQAGIPEASVFWENPERPGVMMRARLDSLSPNMTLDLKTLSNWKGRTVSDMPRRQIEEFEYDIQRRYYDEAREMARQFINEDKVFLPENGFMDGAVDGYYQGLSFLSEDICTKLQAVAAQDNWLWVWLFYQMRDDHNHKAPIVIPRFHQPEGEVWDQAGRKVEQALANYDEWVGRFGLETPWHHIEEALELEDKDLAGLQYKNII